MALKACIECSKEISTDANPCPHCGKKNPHVAPKSGQKYIIPVVIGMCLVTGVVEAVKSTSRRSARAEASSSAASLSTTSRTEEEAANAPPPIEIDAFDLERAYDANEVAADDRYKGRLLVVSGAVTSIDKGIFDEIVVKLGTSNRFNAVHARMQKTEASAAAALRKGTQVDVVCIGNGMIIGSPVLRSCLFAR